MRWIGLAVSTVGVLLAVMLGSGALSFLDLPALLFVLLVGGGILTTAHGVPAIAAVFRALLGRIEKNSLAAVRHTAETGRRSFVAAGWVGVIIGVVQMLSALDDPSQLGQGMAVALLTAFYGDLLGYLIFLPVERATID